MDNLDEYQNYWETNMFYNTEELYRLGGLEEAFGGDYDSSSPEGASSSAAPKSIMSERNRRQKLKERLLALRAVVPKISKLDRASIIKDAIEYIEELHEQERRIQAEIIELENFKKSQGYNDYAQEELPPLLRSKRKRVEQHSSDPRGSSIDVHELRVTCMGEKTLVVSLTCSKRADTMVKLCEVFESLKLNIISANITVFSGRLLKTVFVEGDEEKDHLRFRIESAIAAFSDPQSPLSTSTYSLS